MEINTTKEFLQEDVIASDLVQYLTENEERLGLNDAQMYYEFPIYKSTDGEIIISPLMIVSPNHGIIIIQPSHERVVEEFIASRATIISDLDTVYGHLFSRLIRNAALRKSRSTLSFELHSAIFSPLLHDIPELEESETITLENNRQVEELFEEIRLDESIDETALNEILATIDGAKGIIRSKDRELDSPEDQVKGVLVSNLESAIASFELKQKHIAFTPLDGPQRIRGLAGSGKTIVLTMKAAITHLRNPDAKILYTYYTKSLYQYIKRLITRFYREFDDQDPNWQNIHIMHGWGGKTEPGVYYNAAIEHGIQPIHLGMAKRHSGEKAPFDYVCSQLINDVKELDTIYDYIFVDEGQDFPASFIRLCTHLAIDERVIWAYDDLQTIWQVSAPTPSEIFGVGEEGNALVSLSSDLVLYKCYRNPREILVCAHALGFGIYGDRIVQMLENREHWEDIGYEVINGDFTEGSQIEIERPKENSLEIISNSQEPAEIVQASVFETFDEEVDAVSKQIDQDIKDGLRPDDILVITVDDRAASSYLKNVSTRLANLGIKSNNIHADPYNVKNFQLPDHVTLSTVHKAKGNEGYSVYILGIDAMFSSYSGVRERNMIFTAMTRAKGWVKVSGIGEPAQIFQRELQDALENFPYLRFTYPSEAQLKNIRRDLEEGAIRKMKAERLLDRALKEMTPEEAKRFIEQRAIKKS